MQRDDAGNDRVQQTGRVKSYLEAKGYGFIAREGQRDIFFHATQVRAVRPLMVGERVVFNVGQSEKGAEARNVELELE